MSQILLFTQDLKVIFKFSLRFLKFYSIFPINSINFFDFLNKSSIFLSNSRGIRRTGPPPTHLQRRSVCEQVRGHVQQSSATVGDHAHGILEGMLLLPRNLFEGARSFSHSLLRPGRPATDHWRSGHAGHSSQGAG